jgi:hypothetical protein
VNRNRISLAYQCARPCNVRRHLDIPGSPRREPGGVGPLPG